MSLLDFILLSVLVQTAKAWPIDPLVLETVLKLEVSEKLPQG